MQKKIGVKAPLAVLVTSLLLGCNDSQSSATESSVVSTSGTPLGNTTQVVFDFPQANSNLAGAREFTFYGPISNDSGDLLDDSTLQKIELKHGQDLTLGTHSDGEFSVTAPVSLGEGEYTLIVTFTDGSTAEQSISLNNTSLLHFPISLEIDETNERAFVFEDNAKEIHVFDLESGFGQLLSGSGAGSGVWVGEAGDMYYHSATDSLYLVNEDANAVAKIDVATGERTQVTDSEIDPSNPLNRVEGIAYLNDETLLVAEESEENGVYSVDILTGVKQQVSTDNVGDGELFSNARKLFLSDDKTHVYVADDSEARLVKVELSSGDRTIISGVGSEDVLVGSGEELQSTEGLAYDSTRNQALIADDRQDKLFAVDLTSGDRTVVLDKTSEGALISDITDVDYHLGEQSAYILDKSLDSIVALDMNTSQVRNLLKANGEDISSVEHSGIEVEKLEYDAVNNRVIALQASAIYAIYEDGSRTELSGPNVGVGEDLSYVYDMAIDSQTQRVWVGRDDEVIQVDLATGDRRVISSNSIDSDVLLDEISALHFNGTSLVVGDQGSSTRNSSGDQIVSINIETGKKTVISDGSSSGNAALYDVKQLIQYDGTIYGITGVRPVADELFQVNVATGEKNYITIEDSPVTLDTVDDVAYDSFDHRLLLINDELVLSVDLITQEVETVAGVFEGDDGYQAVGQGVSMYYARAITADEDFIYVFLDEDSALAKISKRTGDRVIVSM